ncbi:MAG: sulfotransferase domain-containing protein [Pseudomonadales bacterium]
MSNLVKPTAPPPVLVLGCGRSGTSIFGELFESTGCYEYRSEPEFADLLAWFASGRAAKVPVASAQYPADPGLSFPLSTLPEYAPRTRLFWIVRHPLDAICSLRVGIGRGWRHHPRPPDWQQWLDRSLIEQCAHHWAFINSLGYAAVQQRAVLVRFEEMIHAPAEFAERVCAELALAEAVDAAALSGWARRVQNSDNAQFIEAQTSRNHSRADHSIRVGRWRENLSKAEVRQVLPIIASASSSFGYDLNDL